MKIISEQEYAALLDKARKHNEKLNAIDAKHGFGSPEDDPFSGVRTAIMAIECGLRTGTADNIFEGVAMLEVVEKQLWLWLKNNPKLTAN